MPFRSGSVSASTERLWFWFGLISVLFLLVLAISPTKDYFREYRRYQKKYHQLLIEKASSRKELARAEAESVCVRQIWIPEFDNRVDRCGSCHLGVDNAAMKGLPPPYGLHPETPHTPVEFNGFGCTICHRGQGRATTLADAHGQVADWDSPLLPLKYTEASCGRCHLGATVPEASLLSQGRRLMARAGCAGCHKFEGPARERNRAPGLDGLSRKTDPAWLRAWLHEPGVLQPGTWMPDFHLSDAEVDSLVAFLWFLPPSASELPREEELARGDPDRGGVLFRESRCISCHTVEGKGDGSAPELAGIGSKTNRRWLFSFVGNPHASQPETAMPRYEFGRQDLIDLTEYMMTEFVDPAAPAPAGAFRPALSLVEGGAKLFGKYGCAACHRISGRAMVFQAGPDLIGIGDKAVALLDFGDRTDLPRALPDWLAAKVLKPRSFRPNLRMPEFGFTEEEVQAVVTALLSLSPEPVPERLRVAAAKPAYDPPGHFGELVRGYRCMSCHQIGGAGEDISTAPLSAEGSKVRRDWLTRYLLAPTTIRPLLTDRMIQLHMPEGDAAFMADFMTNVYVSNEIPAEIFPSGPTPVEVERGRLLFFERYGCQACHIRSERGGYYGPPLDGAGEKLHSGWIAWWLRGPGRWRADVRCPDYGLDETDARDLTAFLIRPESRSPAKPAGSGTGGQP